VSLPVIVPEPGEYVAFGAAKQAAWVLTGKRPGWELKSRALPTGDIHSAALNQFDDLLEKYVENTD
jgi:xylulokinase